MSYSLQLRNLLLDSINEDDPKFEDPNKGEKPTGGTPAENMDVDGKSLESHEPRNGSGVAPPSATQHGAPQGTSQLQGSGDPSANALKKSKPVLTQIGGSSRDDGTWTTSMLPPQNDSGTIIKKFSSETSSPERSSKRNAATVDMDSTEKAAKLKEKKIWFHH